MVRTVNLINEILVPFITNRALIEGLAISDVPGFKAEDLTWIVRYGDLKVELIGESSNHARSEWFNDDQRPNLLRKALYDKELPDFGIPGGHIGIHALYVILENFWRNLAKHNSRAICEAKRLQIVLEISDLVGTLFWNCRLYSPISGSEAVDTVRKILTGGIVDDSGKLIAEGWGTKEMLIAAAHLTCAKLGSIQDNGQSAGRTILGCDRVVRDCQEHLCYQFRVFKPLEMVIVTDQNVDKKNRARLAGNGVHVENEKPKLVPHEYLVMSNERVCEPDSGSDPFKCFHQDVDVNSLTDEAAISTTAASLERRFSTMLYRDDFDDPGETLPELLVPHVLVRSAHTEDTNPFLTLQEEMSESPEPSLVVRCCNQYEQVVQHLQASGQQNGVFHVIFDRHGNLYANDDFRAILDANNNIFWEPYGGGTHTAFTLQHGPSKRQAKVRLLHSLVSSAIMRVMVLDERIQQVLDGADPWKYSTGPRIPPFDCLKKMRVFIPTVDECPLQTPNRENVREFIAKVSPHVVSVHAGILDKLGCRTPEAVEEQIRTIRRIMGCTIRRVVVHSGRGIPSNVPEWTVPFVSFTGVEHWTTSKDLKSKHGLVQELLSARGITR